MDQSTIDWTGAEMGATNSIASRFRNENLAELIRGPGKHVQGIVFIWSNWQIDFRFIESPGVVIDDAAHPKHFRLSPNSLR